MKKLISILIMFVILITAIGCNDSSKNSLPSNFNSESVIPDSSNEEQSNDVENSESDSLGDEDETHDEDKGSSGNTVKPITGGGDFNAGNDYNK